MAAEQPREQLFLARRQERLMRGGFITKFADPRVAVASDAARVLAAEITQRSTVLELACSAYVADPAHTTIDIGERSADPTVVLEWFNKLTTFAIQQFATIIRTVRTYDGADLLPSLAASIAKNTLEFDRHHLGFELLPERDALTSIVD